MNDFEMVPVTLLFLVGLFILHSTRALFLL